MERGQEDIYRSHLKRLRAYLGSCDSLLELVEASASLLESQTAHYNFVSSRTSSLQGACEELLAEQTRLAKLREDIGDRLRKFDVLEPAVKLFSSSGDTVCLEADFIPMLARLDDCLEFVQENIRYRDAELYLMKFRQCMTRGLTLIKILFVNSIRALHSEIKEKITDRQPNDPLAKSLQTSLLYVKFRNLAIKMRPLLFEIEVRCDGHREYLGLLGECFSAYFSVRRSILAPYITTAVSKLSEDADILSIAKSGAAYIMSLCTDECALFYQYFGRGEEDLS
ncbi:Golgi transport complex subunit 3 [Blyttiomyces sp. JEL0837]|nr:Golgi transport complex subunit 3 [Blyttiomyces sp. JEL0837]